MPMVTDTKLGGISPARQLEATFEVYKDWPFDDGRSALLYMVKHFEKHGSDGLSWLVSWLRQKEINEHERASIEMRVPHHLSSLERTTSSTPRVWLQWKLLPGGVLRLLKPILVQEANHVGPGLHHDE